jgi:hypothetical protein
MKKGKLWFGIPLLTLVFGLVLISCPVAPPPTYTVYVKTFNFDSSDTDFGMLPDGSYIYSTITSAKFEWEKENNFKTGATKYEWTEEEIKTFLLGWNFYADKAEREAKWLANVGHGWIGLRAGNLLKIIMK